MSQNFYFILFIILAMNLNMMHTEPFSDKQITDSIELGSGDFEIIMTNNDSNSGFESSIQVRNN
jgi:hypothetical protein